MCPNGVRTLMESGVSGIRECGRFQAAYTCARMECARERAVMCVACVNARVREQQVE